MFVCSITGYSVNLWLSQLDLKFKVEYYVFCRKQLSFQVKLGSCASIYNKVCKVYLVHLHVHEELFEYELLKHLPTKMYEEYVKNISFDTILVFFVYKTSFICRPTYEDINICLEVEVFITFFLHISLVMSLKLHKPVIHSSNPNLSTLLQDFR